MRRIVIGLLALLVSAYFFLHDTHVLGPGECDVNWSAMSDLTWQTINMRLAVLCGCLAVAGLVLVIRGISDEIDR